MFQSPGSNSDVASAATMRAMVISRQDEHLVVECDETGDRVACTQLQASDGPPPVITEGDTVLIWQSHQSPAEGVIIGVIHRALQPSLSSQRSESPRQDNDQSSMPDTLILEAKHSLTLRVGQGSITIREDGKILIKGKDLVSHAQRVNRVKGGSVAIN